MRSSFSDLLCLIRNMSPNIQQRSVLAVICWKSVSLIHTIQTQYIRKMVLKTILSSVARTCHNSRRLQSTKVAVVGASISKGQVSSECNIFVRTVFLCKFSYKNFLENTLLCSQKKTQPLRIHLEYPK